MNPRRFARRGLAPSLPIALSVISFAVGCSQQEAPRPEVVRPVQTMVVAAGDATQVRSFPGRVQGSRSVDLAFQVPGLLVKLPVKEGQSVAKNEVIAQLRQDEFQARLKTVQGQLDQARAALNALRAGERPEERLRREAQVRAAEARLANARTEFERFGRMIQLKAVPRADFDRAETNYRVAQEDYKAALQMLEKGAICPSGRHRGPGGRGSRAGRPRGRSEHRAQGFHAARPLRRRDRPAVRRTGAERQGEGAGRAVPGRGRDRHRRGRAGDGHGRRHSPGRHCASDRDVQQRPRAVSFRCASGDGAGGRPDDADLPGPGRHEVPARRECAAGHDGHGRPHLRSVPAAGATGSSCRSLPSSRTARGSKWCGSSGRIKPSRAAR